MTIKLTSVCGKCVGKGYVEVPNGEDDVEQQMCDVCLGTGVLAVIL